MYSKNILRTFLHSIFFIGITVFFDNFAFSQAEVKSINGLALTSPSGICKSFVFVAEKLDTYFIINNINENYINISTGDNATVGGPDGTGTKAPAQIIPLHPDWDPDVAPLNNKPHINGAPILVILDESNFIGDEAIQVGATLDFRLKNDGGWNSGIKLSYNGGEAIKADIAITRPPDCTTPSSGDVFISIDESYKGTPPYSYAPDLRDDGTADYLEATPNLSHTFRDLAVRENPHRIVVKDNNGCIFYSPIQINSYDDAPEINVAIDADFTSNGCPVAQPIKLISTGGGDQCKWEDTEDFSSDCTSCEAVGATKNLTILRDSDQCTNSQSVPVNFKFQFDNLDNNYCQNFSSGGTNAIVIKVKPISGVNFDSDLIQSGKFFGKIMEGANVGGSVSIQRINDTQGFMALGSLDFGTETFLRILIGFEADIGEINSTRKEFVYKEITINKAPDPILSLDLSSSPMSNPYCSNSTPIVLNSSIPGLFSNSKGGGLTTLGGGSNVSQVRFTPNKGLAGQNIITISVNDGNCTGTGTFEVNVTRSPEIIFESPTSGCVDVELLFNDSGFMQTEDEAEWNWEIRKGLGDIKGYDTKSFMHKFTETGNYTIKLTKKGKGVATGCEVIAETTIVIIEQPQIDFVWDNNCHEDIIQFRTDYVRNPGDNIKWNFGDNSPELEDDLNPTKEYSEPGIYNVTLTVSGKVCGVEQPTPLSEDYDIVIHPRFDEFKEDDSQVFDIESLWIPNIEGVAGWIWKEEPNENLVIGDRGAWLTDYTIQQHINLYGPCINLGALERPKIDLSLWLDTDSRADGAVLQYQKNGDPLNPWITIGGVNTGSNWFNNDRLGAEPGNQGAGWSGKYETWTLASHNLDELKSEGWIKLRLAFASDNIDDGLKDGFAFDSLWIGERKGQAILLEYFSNQSTHQKSIYDLTQSLRDNKEVVLVEYRLGVPAVDPFYVDNHILVSNVRSYYYGLTSPEFVIVDGNHFNDSLTLLTKPKYEQRLAKPTSFIITPECLGSEIKVTIKSEQAQTKQRTLVLHTLAYEEIDIGGGGTANIAHSMLPDNDGTYTDVNNNNIGDPWMPNEERTFLIPLNGINTQQYKIVLFIQDYDTKEILQTVLANDVRFPSCRLAGGNNPKDTTLLLEDLAFKIFPNPTTTHFNLSFNKPLEELGQWQIYNQIGQLVGFGSLAKGQQTFKIGEPEWASGMYFLQVKVGTLLNENRNIVIQRD